MILVRASLRHLLRHPWHLVLSVIGVALGVAVVVAVDLATGSARRAFDLSAAAVTGPATHTISGGPTGLPDALYTRLRVDVGVHDIAPVIEAYVTANRAPARPLRLVGIDPLAQSTFAPEHALPGAGDPRLLTMPDAVALTAPLAQRLGVSAGARLSLEIGGHRRVVTVVAVGPRQAGFDDILITDVASAQSLLSKPGRLTRIDLRVPDGSTGAGLLARVRAALPPDANLTTAASRSAAFVQMTHAFRINLVALSLLVLVVGLFLIYNTMTFSVVQRRAHIAIVRALGLTRREVFAWISAEALVIGILGTALGLAAGVALGEGLVRLVTRTINDLYFVVSVRALTVAPASLAKGLILGVVATLAAAAVPAWEATRTSAGSSLHRSSLEHGVRRFAPVGAWTALALCALAALLLGLARHSLVLSYAGLFLVILGFALLTPIVVITLMRMIRPPLAFAFGTLGALAPRSVSAALSRTGVAIASLAIAVAATIAIGAMIISFRTAFLAWLGHQLRADVYVTAPSFGSAGDATLDPSTIAAIERTPGVGTVTYARRVRVMRGSKTIELFALATTRTHFRNFQFTDRPASAVWPAFHNGAIIVSEPYATHHDVKVGDRLPLPTAEGSRDFRVAGIFVDYGSDQGVVSLDLRTYRRNWHDPSVTSLGLYLPSHANPDAVITRLRAATHDLQALVFESNRALRKQSITIFDRTFAVTAVLRVLTALVAFVGVLSALMAWQLERARELAILRATGLTPLQLGALVTGETALMGLTAGLLALPLGIGLAALLIRIINVRSFGWSMPLAVEPGLLLQALILAIVAALLAGIYPAYKMARTPPALALREE